MSKFDNLLPVAKSSKLQSSKALKSQIVEATVERKMGRPKAKHSDRENYHQTTIYIHREVFGKAKARLFEQGGGEMSALLEKLLREWLQKGI